jgi:hypothetical protein
MMKIIIKHDLFMKKPYHAPPSVELQTKNIRAQFWAFVDELLGSKNLFYLHFVETKVHGIVVSWRFETL